MFCLGTIEMHGRMVLLIPAVGQLPYLTLLVGFLFYWAWGGSQGGQSFSAVGMQRNLGWWIGSTEWVEQNLINLGSKAVAYLNVDCAVQGPGFFVGSTPQLDNLILEVMKKVKDPDSEGVSLYENWAAGGGGNNVMFLSLLVKCL
ncbi:probable glutamate carboxypeptidase PLA3 isoform X2 [Cajanus cajan]|uniref:probable glutamate carboxypeptidase PLA3 isoform X2 n=1 Tax=Cajanus cajan TaxID=3821 RepID=UPI00098DC0DD|nr:probable glutamate carboxypeptidase PLA3 isoform X2 [Cajanus cajan]XP_029126880.1 probable glutamate carboxypeptidase PLA3 isoform X2 [Cajanus cajan]